jgi:hypothetical protein
LILALPEFSDSVPRVPEIKQMVFRQLGFLTHNLGRGALYVRYIHFY